MKILLDTNVVLDIALDRKPFCEAAVRVFEASDFEKIHLFITGSIATDLYYVLRRETGHETAMAFLKDLLECVDVCSVDKTVLLGAMDSDFTDFEDAVQNSAAVGNDLEIILTRNKADFRTSSLTILEPKELVNDHLR